MRELREWKKKIRKRMRERKWFLSCTNAFSIRDEKLKKAFQMVLINSPKD